MAKDPKIIDDESSDPFKRGLDDRDFGRGPPQAPDPDTATPDEIADYLARKEAYDSRDDYNEDGDLKEDA